MTLQSRINRARKEIEERLTRAAHENQRVTIFRATRTEHPQAHRALLKMLDACTSPDGTDYPVFAACKEICTSVLVSIIEHELGFGGN